VSVFVLDAWALLAWLQDEQPAARAVGRSLVAAESGEVELHLSLINAGEVYYSLVRERGRRTAMRFRDGLANMPVRIHVPAAEDIWQAAQLKSRRRISYADGFAAALALRLDGTLMTGDPDFAGIGGLRVDWLKRE
jgi:ribonuclease VapC